MKYGCCTSIDNYDLIAASGYDRIILSATEISCLDDFAFAAVCRKMTYGPLECNALNSFCSPQLLLCGPGYDQAAVKNYIRALAVRAAQLGVRQIGIGAPKSRNISNNITKEQAMVQFKNSLTILCDVCRPYNIEILLEAVCDLECNFIMTTDEAREIVEDLMLDNLGIVFDSYHAYMMQEDDQPLRRAMHHVKLVHLAQNIENKRHYLKTKNLEDYRVYTKALLENGYDGEISVEAFAGNIEEELANTLNIMHMLVNSK